MLLLAHAKFRDVQLGKAASNCLASTGLWQGLSASCSCLAKSRCWMPGCSSLRSWLHVSTTAPADPSSDSLGSRWAVSTSSFSWERHRRRGDCWLAGSAAASGTACREHMQQEQTSSVRLNVSWPTPGCMPCGPLLLPLLLPSTDSLRGSQLVLLLHGTGVVLKQ